jgi:hypothetical protein
MHHSYHPRINGLDVKHHPDSAIDLNQTIGNQTVQRQLHSNAGFNFAKIGIQLKLKISQPEDAYEREADRVAEQVMRMSAPQDSVITIGAAKGKGIGRKCTACEMKENEEKIKISRKPYSESDLETNDHTTAEINSIRSSTGTSLDSSTREFMESRFGYDFGKVKIHTDERAARSSNSVNALAYTIGNDVVFGQGKYQPNTVQGRGLLAHELTHVIQQNGSSRKTNVSPSPSNDLMVNNIQTPAQLIYRSPMKMPADDRKQLENCSQTHRDSDLDLRAEKYKRDEVCIYSIIKCTLGKELEDKAGKLIEWASANQMLAGEMLQAMYSAQVTGHPFDKFGAGTVYAIVSAAGASGYMNKLRDGTLKVLVLTNEEFNKELGTSSPEKIRRTKAMYVPQNDIVLLRFESISIDDLNFRATVIHELTHSSDDAGKVGGTIVESEMRARGEAAGYILKELENDESAMDSVAQEIVDTGSSFDLTAILIQMKTRKQFHTIGEKLAKKIIDTAAERGQRLSFESLNALSVSQLQELLKKQLIATGYTEDPANFGGLTKWPPNVPPL